MPTGKSGRLRTSSTTCPIFLPKCRTGWKRPRSRRNCSGARSAPTSSPSSTRALPASEAMADEAERFGVVISGDFAKKSEEVNDNLKRLGLQSKATGIAIAADLLPPLNRLLGEYLDAKLSGLSF